MGDGLTNAILENRTKPAEASVGGQKVKQHSLREQIEADRYMSAKEAANRKGLPFR
jgi:hypothetical protein